MRRRTKLKSRPRPRVKKSQLWTKSEARELAKLAQNFLEAKAKARA